MGNFAEAMAKTVQQIHTAAQTRRDSLSQLQHTTQEFLQACQVAEQHRITDLQQMARDLKRQMQNTERTRLDTAQQFLQETQQAIQDIGVRVSELRSDTHNLVQRFAMEHRDMAQQLHRSLAAHSRARLDSARTVAHQHQSDRRSLGRHLRREAQHLLASLQNADRERQCASARDLQAVASDLRQASQIWRHDLKKKHLMTQPRSQP